MKAHGLLVLALLGLAAPAAAQTETIEYYGTDAIGSVRVVFDPSGAILARQDYGPFGQPLLAAPAQPPEGFGGQSTDDEAQQAYFHARQFQARLGRFATIDSVFDGVFDPQRWNRYAYAGQNALRFTDYSGLSYVYHCPTKEKADQLCYAEDPVTVSPTPNYHVAAGAGGGGGGGGGAHIRPEPRRTQSDEQIERIAAVVAKEAGPMASPAAPAVIYAVSSLGAAAPPAIDAAGYVITSGSDALVLVEANTPGATQWFMDYLNTQVPSPSLEFYNDLIRFGMYATVKIVRFTFGPHTGPD